MTELVHLDMNLKDIYDCRIYSLSSALTGIVDGYLYSGKFLFLNATEKYYVEQNDPRSNT